MMFWSSALFTRVPNCSSPFSLGTRASSCTLPSLLTLQTDQSAGEAAHSHASMSQGCWLAINLSSPPMSPGSALY